MLSALFLALSAQAGDFVVAPGGDDANPGSAEKPFATLTRARDAARAAAKRPVTILLRGGTYYLPETLLLSAEDSNATWAAWPGENPVVSGGVPVRGWKPVEVDGRRMWAAAAPPGTDPRQIFVNGRRAVRARLPEEGFYTIAEVLDGAAQDRGADRFRYALGDVKAWSNLADVEVVVLHFWHDSRLPVTRIDEAERIVHFGKKSIRRMTVAHGPEPAPYFVENAFEALDKPGEWCVDTKQGMIHYMPRPGEEPGKVEAVSPRLRHIVRFEGCSDVRFRGVSFAHAVADAPPRGTKAEVCGPSQAAVTAPGALHFERALACTVERGEIAHVGSYAVEIGPGCSGIKIARNEIHDLGAGGVKIGEERARTVGDPLQTSANEISDNRLHHGGRIFQSAVGVLVLQSGGNVVAHNEIHDFYYTGVSVGWTWGYKPNPAARNVVEQNHIHDLGFRWLSDMGGVYTLGPSPGTVVRNNLIHDVDARGYGGWGIYTDEGSTGIVIENNVVYRTKDGGFHQHYGKENVVRNNVFAFARECQVARSRFEGHLSFTFERNIVYWKEGAFFRKGYSDKVGEGYTFDRNVYFHAGGGPVEVAGGTFAGWQQRGQDRASLVADPLFMDPAKDDFRLRPESPALRLGFIPIDMSTVGPRPR